MSWFIKVSLLHIVIWLLQFLIAGDIHFDPKLNWFNCRSGDHVKDLSALIDLDGDNRKELITTEVIEGSWNFWRIYQVKPNGKMETVYLSQMAQQAQEIQIFGFHDENGASLFVLNRDGILSQHKGLDARKAHRIQLDPVPGNVAVADVDLDGDLEVVSMSSGTRFMIVDLATGTTEFEDETLAGGGNLKIGNADDDPQLEIIYPHFPRQYYVVDGANHTLEKAVYDAAGSQFGVADLNRDGRIEIFGPISPSDNATLRVLNLDSEQELWNLEIPYQHCDVGDMGANGSVEIYAFNEPFRDIDTYSIDGATGQVIWQGTLETPNSYYFTEKVRTADIDCDGSVEVAVTDGKENYIYDLASSQLETISGPYQANTNMNAIAWSDIDRNGAKEFSYTYSNSESLLTIDFLDNLSGHTVQTLSLNGVGDDSVKPAFLAQVQGDQNKEIIVAADETLSVFDGTDYHLLSSTRPFNKEITKVIPADFDLDGNDELVVVCKCGYPGQLKILDGKTLAEIWNYEAPLGIWDVLTQDLNNDQVPELILGGMHLLVLDGATKEVLTDGNYGLGKLSLFDWNRDGNLDIVNCNSKNVYVTDSDSFWLVAAIPLGEEIIPSVRVYPFDLNHDDNPEWIIEGDRKVQIIDDLYNQQVLFESPVIGSYIRSLVIESEDSIHPILVVGSSFGMWSYSICLSELDQFAIKVRQWPAVNILRVLEMEPCQN